MNLATLGYDKVAAASPFISFGMLVVFHVVYSIAFFNVVLLLGFVF